MESKVWYQRPKGYDCILIECGIWAYCEVKNMTYKIGRFNFSQPILLSQISVIDRAGIYVILCVSPNGQTNVIYVGQSGEMRVRLSQHEKASCWSGHCYGGVLWVATLYLPTNKYSKQQRLGFERELINQFNPACNAI